MSLKTILVCLTSEQVADPLMTVASGLARQTGAHLIGLHTTEALLVYPGIAMHIPGPVFAQFNAGQREDADRIKAVFERHTAAEDFVSEWRLLRTESTTAAHRMIESARSADLVIMAQEDRVEDRADQRHVQDDVIRESGRPVLVVPRDYDGALIGKSLVLGWSDTREATRAAHDLLGVAAPKARICVLRIGAKAKDELTDHSSIELAETYARHGLNALTVHREKAGRSISEILHHEAAEQGADMIATGAFGHSRSYDFVIGAATRDLLHHATLPVLFSK